MKNTLAENAENTSGALSSGSTYSTGEAPACVLSLLSQESHTYKWSWSSTEGHRERYRQPGASGQHMGLGKGHALGMLSAQVQKCYRYTKWSWITLFALIRSRLQYRKWRYAKLLLSVRVHTDLHVKKRLLCIRTVGRRWVCLSCRKFGQMNSNDPTLRKSLYHLFVSHRSHYNGCLIATEFKVILKSVI